MNKDQKARAAAVEIDYARGRVVITPQHSKDYPVVDPEVYTSEWCVICFVSENALFIPPGMRRSCTYKVTNYTDSLPMIRRQVAAIRRRWVMEGRWDNHNPVRLK